MTRYIKSDSGNKLRITINNEDGAKSITRNVERSLIKESEIWVSCLINTTKIGDGGFWIRPNSKQDLAIGK